MKYLKVIVPLLVVVALLVMALPAGAQGPRPVFVRTAGTNEDPFGGFPIGTNVTQQADRTGVTALFGLAPWATVIPGGVPSDKSGDGTSARKAIYIGGAWANGAFTAYGQGNPSGGGGGWSPFTRAANENPMEIPSCATIKIPAGTSRWFKTDSWVRAQGGQNLKLQVWLDDELNTATAPSGSATWGAADNYMWGANNESPWVQNGWDIYPWAQGYASGNPIVEGFVFAIYDPDNMKPNYAFTPPNATLYTLAYSAAGSPRRSCQGSVGCDNGRGISGTGVVYASGQPGAFSNIHGYGEFNPNVPNHLLWWEGVMDGWVHVRVYNQMIWDGVATVCSYRANR